MKEKEIKLASAHCPSCEQQWEGHASDVGEAMWRHEEETEHDPVVDDEWVETISTEDN